MKKSFLFLFVTLFFVPAAYAQDADEAESLTRPKKYLRPKKPLAPPDKKGRSEDDVGYVDTR